MEVDHDLVVVDEFDALSIEVKSAGQSPQGRPKFPAKLHAQKVAKELGAKSGLIYLPGLPEVAYEYSDQSPVFRQRRYFFYLTGADFPRCTVTYDIAGDKLTLWIPKREPREVMWLGALPDIAECKKRFDVDDVCYGPQLAKYLHNALSGMVTLYCLDEAQKPDLGERHRRSHHIDTGRLRSAMDRARMVKSDYELAMIRKANEVSAAAHKAVLERIRRLSHETEIEAVFIGSCLAQGAKKQAYGVIAGSGSNAAILHYMKNDEPLEGRQLVCLDGGAEWNCYASDVTRTFPISGALTPEARKIYQLVEKMQEECIARVAPGILFSSLEWHARRVAVDGLLELGLLHGGDADELLRLGVVRAFFPHGLGHHVGLEVHDVVSPAPTGRMLFGGKRDIYTQEMHTRLLRARAGLPSGTAMEPRLQKNMVVTIEPGIYFNRDFIEANFLSNPISSRYINKNILEKFYPVGGCRIEDDILVTGDGYENITKAPKGEEALGIINGK